MNQFLLPQELLSAVNDAKDGHYLETTILKVEFYPNLVVTFDLCYAGDTWQFIVSECKEFRIGTHHLSYIEFEIYDEHPMLDKYNKNEYYLYIGNKPADAAKLIGDIYVVHEQLYNSQVPVDRYFTGNLSYGVFAMGPKHILNEYKNVLDQHVVINNILLDKNANTDPYQILILSKGYFIGRNFEFQKM